MNTKVYPTREDYAREVWASLDAQTRTDTITEWHDVIAFGPVVPFYGWMADNMDARHNGTVTFTRTEGGYTVQDDTDAEDYGDCPECGAEAGYPCGHPLGGE